jgi:hypothetical protein
MTRVLIGPYLGHGIVTQGIAEKWWASFLYLAA